MALFYPEESDSFPGLGHAAGERSGMWTEFEGDLPTSSMPVAAQDEVS